MPSFSISSLLLKLTIIITMGIMQSKSFSLTKKSTARDVLEYLQSENKMVSYAKNGGTAIVTGGNSGIGRITVECLVEVGMKVVLCARNMEAASQVRDELPEGLRKRVTIQHLDLADLDSVKKASQDILSNCDGSIDCLVNNAGIMALPERQESSQGLELQFGTNHVGHHYFTRLLLPQMSNNGRIVCVSSTAHKLAPSEEDWESKNKYSAWGAYGRSKLANLLFAKSLTDKLPAEKGLQAVSLHPGIIKTPLWKHTGFLGAVFGFFFADKNMDQGAATNVYCALVDQVEPGAWYSDCQPASTSAPGQDEKLRESLWQYTETLLANKGYSLPKELLVGSKEKVSQ